MFVPSEEEVQSEFYKGFEEMDDSEDEIIDSLALQLADIPVLRPCDGIEAPAMEDVPDVSAPVDAQSTPQTSIPSPPQTSIHSLPQTSIPSPPQTSIPSLSFRRGYTSTGGLEEVVQKMQGLEKEVREVKGVGEAGFGALVEKMDALQKEVRELKELREKDNSELKGVCEGMAKDIQYLCRLQDMRQPRESRVTWWRRSPSWTSQGRRKRKAEKPNPRDVAKKLKFAGGGVGKE